MGQLLITGATGNVGRYVLRHLYAAAEGNTIIAAVRNPDSTDEVLAPYPNLARRRFDFNDPGTYAAAFAGIDRLFLLRPPAISDVRAVFAPLLTAARESGLHQIVFLSVQGVEQSAVIPHHKIENLIQEFGFAYIFVRPSYFMQNLTTTLLDEIRRDQTITLPAGTAKFNWVDTENIGAACARLLLNFPAHRNEAIEITGPENLNFGQAAHLLTEVTGRDVRYRSVNPFRFFLRKWRAGTPAGFALVMTLLHFLPRLQAEPHVSDSYQKLTGERPTSLGEFIVREHGRGVL